MPRLKSSRSAALTTGDKFYRTGKPCVRGHLAKRWSINWTCYTCKKDKQNAWAEKNRLTLRRKKKKLYYSNPEKYREKTRRWAKENPEKKLAYQKAWRKNNWLKVLASNAKRRVKGGKGGCGFSDKCVLFIIERQNGMCIYCEKDLALGFHIDHKTPLSRDGLNSRRNIQILCPKCNLRKGVKTHREFLHYQRVADAT